MDKNPVFLIKALLSSYTACISICLVFKYFKEYKICDAMKENLSLSNEDKLFVEINSYNKNDKTLDSLAEKLIDPE